MKKTSEALRTHIKITIKCSKCEEEKIPQAFCPSLRKIDKPLCRTCRTRLYGEGFEDKSTTEKRRRAERLREAKDFDFSLENIKL